MKSLFIKNLLLCILFPVIAISQNISVKSFNILSHNLDAKTYYPVDDQNGDKAALIKIVTTEKGFKWEGDGLGIVSTEYKTGEYWVYVPYGAKRLTIKHPKLGIIRDYVYPISIKEATVYEMILTTGKVITTIEDYIVPTQWLVISSSQEGALVYINDEYKGEAPYQQELDLGKYTYRLEYPMYLPSAGVVELMGDKPQVILSIDLKPNFGSTYVVSVPENGAKVFIDGRNTGKTTPCLLENLMYGSHRISLNSKWYSPLSKTIEVSPESKDTISIKMHSNYGELKIITDSESKVFLDGKYLESEISTYRVTSGYHNIEVKKDKYRTVKEKLRVGIGEKKELELYPIPIFGKLKIISNPFGATIKVDGIVKGLTPASLDSILIGNHELSIEKDNYSKIIENIIIIEDQTESINIELSKGNSQAISNTISVQKKPTINPDIIKYVEEGEKYYGKGNYQSAYNQFIKAANLGDATAQYYIGFMYYTGIGKNKSNKVAYSWFVKSAKQGNSSAEYMLGKIYFRGDARPKDYKEAYMWFMKSAKQNNETAQFMVGKCNEFGFGIYKNIEEAKKWYKRACKKGEPKSCAALKRL